MRHIRGGALAVPLAGLLVITACSSSGSTSNAASKTGRSGMLAYSQCMRSHGISDFPDPSSSGGLTLNGPGNGDLDPSSPKYQAANTACAPLNKSSLSPAQQQNQYKQGLKFARCMRAHGVPNWPDPQPPSTGPVNVQGSAGAGQGGPPVNTNSPAFIAANKVCGKYLGGNGPSLNTSGGPK